MCVASAVTDHFQKEWGTPWAAPTFRVITEAQWAEYQRLKKAAEEIDEKTHQPNCIKPGLEEWESRMKEYVTSKWEAAFETS